MTEEQDIQHIKRSFQLAKQAVKHGNHPFGALLVDADGKVIAEAENTTQTERDCSGHAELNLVRSAGKLYDWEFLASSTLYSSAEPCVMCAGAILWSGVGRVVFGLGVSRFNEILQSARPEWIVRFSCREVFDKGSKKIDVVGPLLEEEAEEAVSRFFLSG